jgi:hypothetical protein
MGTERNTRQALAEQAVDLSVDLRDEEQSL